MTPALLESLLALLYGTDANSDCSLHVNSARLDLARDVGHS